jgi:hypothetical protein
MYPVLPKEEMPKEFFYRLLISSWSGGLPIHEVYGNCYEINNITSDNK